MSLRRSHHHCLAAGVQPGLAIFVIHGIGTGKLKAALLDMLKDHPMVLRLEPDRDADGTANGGCTIVYPK